MFTRARHWSLSSAGLIQSMPTHSISPRSILILSSHLGLGFHTAVLNTRIRRILNNNPITTKNVSQRNTNHDEVPARCIKSGANLVVMVHTTLDAASGLTSRN
jgi:hypothetical protein